MTSSLMVLVGAGPGLGLSVAKRFVRENFTVALIARHEEKLKAITDEVNQINQNAYAFAADITKEDEVKKTFSAIHQQFGPSRVLVYNASGRFEMKGICELSPENLLESWKATCLGGLLSAQQVLPEMAKQKQGTIIFSGATAALRGGANLAGLAVSKFSQRALAQSMAREFGPKGVHVAHVIIDGQIATPDVLKHFPDRPLHTFLDPDAIAETYWQLHNQHPTAWTQEMDLRPAVEKF